MNSETLQNYEGIVRSIARTRLAEFYDQNDVEDIVQDVMLDLIEKPRDTLDELQEISTTDRKRRLFNLIRKATINYRPLTVPPPRRWRIKPSELAKKLLKVPYPGKTVDEEVEEGEIRTHLNQAAMQLREPYRSAVQLYFYENVPLEKTAGRLGFSVKHIHSLLEKSLNQLRDNLHLANN